MMRSLDHLFDGLADEIADPSDSSFTVSDRKFLKQCFLTLSAELANTLISVQQKLKALEEENKQFRLSLDKVELADKIRRDLVIQRKSDGPEDPGHFVDLAESSSIRQADKVELTDEIRSDLVVQRKSYGPEDPGHFVDLVESSSIRQAQCSTPLLVAPELRLQQSRSDIVIQRMSIDDAVDVSALSTGPGNSELRAHPKGSEVSDRTGHKRSHRNRGAARGAKTMMICNIPCRVTHADIVDAIDSMSFSGTFEVHLPCRDGQDSNLGYGFVRFFRQTDAESFAVAFEGYRFSHRESTKACTVRVADCQGRLGRRMTRSLRQAQKTPP